MDMLNLINQPSDFCYTNKTEVMIDETRDLVFITQQNNIYLDRNNHIPTIGEFIKIQGNINRAKLYLFGKINNLNCYCYADDIELVGKLNKLSLRTAYQNLPLNQFHAALLANQLSQWFHAHVHCGYCGSLTTLRNDEFALICTKCAKVSYPTISPCVIILINDGDKILLAKNKNSVNNMYSCIAGFVNPCENLEHAVQREIMEEVGLEVKNIRYISSQPWPFPQSLMMGFFADYASGEINVDYDELADANWYSLKELDTVNLPSEISIARFLIKKYYDEFTK